MPVEIIDLLSSPDLPQPKPRQSRVANVPSKALTFGPSNASNDEWLTLSSDDIGVLSPSKNVATIPPDIISMKPASNFNPRQQTNSTVKTANFHFLSDDLENAVNLDDDPFESDPPLSTSVKPKSHVSTISTKFLSNIEGTSMAPQMNSTKVFSDICFLSDDFDSPVNFDDPSTLDIQPPKRQRLSPPPKAASSKVVMPKRRDYKTTVSNIESSTKPDYSRTANLPTLRKSKTMGSALETDPILFTSSPDPFEDAARRRKEKRKKTLGHEDDLFDFGLNSREKDEMGTKALRTVSGNKRIGFSIDNSSDIELPDIGDLPSKADFKPYKSSQTALAKYNAEKAKEKAAKEKAEKLKEKAASKDAEKGQKRLAREEKAREKEKAAEVAKVNLLRTDKKVSTPEMIVDLPSCLDSKIIDHVRNFLTPLQVEHSEWQSSIPVIKWRRKVNSEWNDELGYWEPVSLKVKTEKHVMCVLSAQEFVDLTLEVGGSNLDAHILKLKAIFGSSKIIYLIEGFVAWLRKNRNVKNRQFTEAVRNHIDQDEPSASQRTKKKKDQQYVDEDIIEDGLLRLQVIHEAQIHHTGAPIDTAEWIMTFTQHISTIPYKARQQSLDTAFCMESGQVKTGENAADTYTRMLQEVIRVTAPIAYGIAAEYPTVQKLATAFRMEGPLLLEDCRKSANKDGAFTDRRVGPSISKRLYKVFMGRDAGSWDI